MKILRSLSAGTLSFFGSLVVVLCTYRLLEGAAISVKVAGIYASGLGLGAALGRSFGREQLVSTGVGAFLAVGLLWTPVVLVTYGFALAAVPLLVVYSLGVSLGAWLAARGRNKPDVTA